MRCRGSALQRTTCNPTYMCSVPSPPDAPNGPPLPRALHPPQCTPIQHTTAPHRFPLPRGIALHRSAVRPSTPQCPSTGGPTWPCRGAPHCSVHYYTTAPAAGAPHPTTMHPMQCNTSIASHHPPPHVSLHTTPLYRCVCRPLYKRGPWAHCNARVRWGATHPTAPHSPPLPFGTCTHRCPPLPS